MSKQKEIRNESVLPDTEIERLAKMLLPSILAAWETENEKQNPARQAAEESIVQNS